MAKRLTRNRKGSIVLPSGETITKAEQKAFKSAITSVNARRRRELVKRPEQMEDFLITGHESDFTLRKRSGSFGQFHSKAQFNQALKMARYISSGQASKVTASTYQQNYIKGLYNMFDSAAYPLIEKIGKIDPKKWRELAENGKLPDLGYIYYDPDNEKFEELSAALDRLALE